MSLSKMIMGQSGNQGSGAGLDVDEVFSTFLYDGNSSTQTITNNIDLSNEGGLVWIKSRSDGQSHELVDTVRGNTKFIRTNSTTANRTSTSGDVTGFTSSGFSLGATTTAGVNNSSNEYVSWTFRKAPKFFDIVQYTGTGNNQTISHNLGSVPGMIITKRTDSTSDWAVYHRGLNGGTNPATKFIRLNLTNAESGNSGYWNDTEPTNSVFTVGSNSTTNANNGTFIAYLFAHNNSDGEFGPSANQDIIKCGSYTGNGSSGTSGPSIDLGFEPQWVMIKRANNDTGDWKIFDAMRGVATGGTTNLLEPNTSDAEVANNDIDFDANGFNVINSNARINASGSDYIYMAIRRGPLTAPTSASNVFDIDTLGSTGDSADPGYRTTFPVDFALRKDTGSGNWEALTRLLQGTSLRPNDNNAEDSGSSGDQFDYMNGYNTGTSTDSSKFSWMWKRAPKYFDVVCYTGTSGAQTINHNLGVVPEMIWIKKRSEASFYGFTVYHGTTGNMMLANDFSSGFGSSNAVNHSNISATTFEVASGNVDVNDNGETHVAYLFASVAGVSKIGSVAHSGSSTDVDCGFSNGSKFVLLKRTDAADNWRLFDSDRGIVSGNDNQLFVNLSSAESTSNDLIDPLSSGFQITDDLTDGTYLFYAIAA